MRYFLIIPILFLFLPPAASAWPGRIVTAIDGDTIEVEPSMGGQRVRVRLHGIDAPEKRQPWGESATGFCIGRFRFRSRGRALTGTGARWLLSFFRMATVFRRLFCVMALLGSGRDIAKTAKCGRAYRMMPACPGAVFGLSQTQRLLGFGGSRGARQGNANSLFPSLAAPKARVF